MAEFELAVKYRTPQAKVGLYTMAALMPVWSIIVPFCLGLFITLLMTQSVAIGPAAVVLAILIAIPLVSVVLAALCEDDQVGVSKEGFTFPLGMLPKLQFKRERLWSDLKGANLIGSPGKHKKMLLEFKSGGHSLLDLRYMSEADLEQLLLAIEVWGVNCDRTDQLVEFQNKIQNENRGLEQISYTQMWEEELSRRFSATSFVPLEPGRVLQGGRFTVVRQLAFGGLSAIYLAQHKNKELVVLKEAVVPASADQQSRLKAVELFDREAKFLIKLSNPNIAKVSDYFAEEGRNYLVLEYIRGQDLRQLVKQNGPQSELEVVKWSIQVVGILQYLHTQRPPIIHRDLTPDNLVRRDDGHIVLIDFGAANEFVGTATGTLVGKQAYIAPEQLRGKATTQSDIYALGGTMFFLLTGRDPEALSASRPKELVPTISDELDELVDASTQLEPCDRPATADGLLPTLQKLLQKLERSTTMASDEATLS